MLICHSHKSANATNTFQRVFTYPSSNLYLGNPLQTADFGFMLMGTMVDTMSPENSEIILIKTDTYGVQQWSKLYSSGNHDNGNAYLIDYDGSVVMTGSFYLSNSPLDNDIFVVKTDSAGNQLWSKGIGGTRTESAAAIALTSDSGYLIAANSWSFDTVIQENIYLVKLDRNGNRIWSKVLYRDFGAKVSSIKPTFDGGFILSGTCSYPYNLLAIKIDDQGVPQWSKNYNGLHEDWAYDAVQTSDSGYMVLGETMDGDDCTIFKTDSLGAPEWSKILSLGSQTIHGYNLLSGFDDNYYIAGWVPDTIMDSTAFILKLDINGNILSAARFESNISPFQRNFIQLLDSSFLVANYDATYPLNTANLTKIVPFGGVSCPMAELIISESPITLTSDTGLTWFTPDDSIWDINTIVQNTSLVENVICQNIGTGIEESISSIHSILLYPNPSHGKLTIRFSADEIRENSISIINSFGQIVYNANSNDEELLIDTHNWSTGLYHYFVYSDRIGLRSGSVVVVAP